MYQSQNTVGKCRQHLASRKTATLSIPLRAGPCTAFREDIELERQTQGLKDVIVRTMMNAYNDLFILKLPPEVPSHIFLLSMRERDSNKLYRPRGALPTPFLFGALCRGWGQLARSTPELWSTLALTLCDSMHSMKMEVLSHCVDDWLERSGGVPLTLQTSYDGSGNPPEDRYGSVIDSLSQHSGHWYNVDFQALPESCLVRLCGSSPAKKTLQLCTFSFIPPVSLRDYLPVL